MDGLEMTTKNRYTCEAFDIEIIRDDAKVMTVVGHHVHERFSYADSLFNIGRSNVTRITKQQLFIGSSIFKPSSILMSDMEYTIVEVLEGLDKLKKANWQPEIKMFEVHDG